MRSDLSRRFLTVKIPIDYQTEDGRHYVSHSGVVMRGNTVEEAEQKLREQIESDAIAGTHKGKRFHINYF